VPSMKHLLNGGKILQTGTPFRIFEFKYTYEKDT
jgi:hypothetical protein